MTNPVIRRLAIGGAGLVLAIVLTVIEGVKYRLREEQGLDPMPAPDWVAGATTAGLWIFALALVILAVLGVIALVNRKR